VINHFEEFTAGPNRRSGERMYITLNDRNVILLNYAAFAEIGQPEAVVLLFDKANSINGIRPSHPKIEHAFPLKAKPGSRHRLIAASPFCRHHGIRVEGTVAFHSVERDRDGMLKLYLSATTVAGRVKAETRT
jgi:hypothetical protein